MVNGGGGVTKIKEVNGAETQLQHLISVLIPMNGHRLDLPGAQDTSLVWDSLQRCTLPRMRSCTWIQKFFKAPSIFSVWPELGAHTLHMLARLMVRPFPAGMEVSM